MSNPHAHPHTMRKTHAKFQNNWYKTVRGVALTRDTLCLYNQGEKWLSWQCRKSDKNWSNNYVQSTCTSSYHEENTCKVSKQWVQNCKRSCAHKIPMLNVDGWTDGRTYERMNVRTDECTNGRKLARLCHPAKAGATKNHQIKTCKRYAQLPLILKVLVKFGWNPISSCWKFAWTRSMCYR